MNMPYAGGERNETHPDSLAATVSKSMPNPYPPEEICSRRGRERGGSSSRSRDCRLHKKADYRLLFFCSRVPRSLSRAHDGEGRGLQFYCSTNGDRGASRRSEQEGRTAKGCHRRHHGGGLLGRTSPLLLKNLEVPAAYHVLRRCALSNADHAGWGRQPRTKKMRNGRS